MLSQTFSGMTPKLTLMALWLYVTLLLTGGAIGLIKAGSKISLVMSAIFALLVALCALGFIHPFYIADILVGALAVFFGVRYFKSGKFMPSGLMMAFSLVILTVLIVAPLQDAAQK
jgi:uncharacterized membrane protein (UPF0136 family)